MMPNNCGYPSWTVSEAFMSNTSMVPNKCGCPSWTVSVKLCIKHHWTVYRAISLDIVMVEYYLMLWR